MVEGTVRRNTRQRQVVLEELRRLTSHPTAAELYELARRRLPKISMGTVYRNLELLVQMGVIRKLETGGGEARFDGDSSRHHHIRCTECGRVDDVHGLPPETAMYQVTDVSGYEVLGFRLEWLGVCPMCQAREEPPGGEGPIDAAD